MNRNCIIVFCFLYVLAPFNSLAQDAFPGWYNDLAKAAEVAAEAKKPIFAVFRCVR